MDPFSSTVLDMFSTSVQTWPPGLLTLHSTGQYNGSSTCVWPDCAPICEVLSAEFLDDEHGVSFPLLLKVR